MKMVLGNRPAKVARLLSRFLFTLISILIFLFASCTRKPPPYSILEFEGKGGVYNYSKSLLIFGYEADSIYKNAILAAPGDLIMYGENNFFEWKESSQNRYSYKNTDNIYYINDKISSILVPATDTMISWFKQMNKIDLSELEFLNFGHKINESYFPFLTELAKTKPDIGLIYSGEFKDMAPLLKIFMPRIIIGGNLSSEDYSLLSGLDNLEILSVALHDSLITKPLPAMKKLKQINLMWSDHNPEINDDFLVNNSQIENLVIMSAGKIDFSILNPILNLKELVINECDTIENFELIKEHKQIEVFVLNWDNFRYNISRNELPAIRWTSFITDATQVEFDSFVASNENLEVVEILNNENIKSFEPLLKLRKLYGLTIADTLTDFNTLKSLKNLKYLSLPWEVFSDSLKNDELKKALPNTRFVSTHGVCLGTGWLLLIIPLVLLSGYVSKIRYGQTRG
jgi:hypothetical protein